ncbi:MAG: hypothetical protein K2W96_26880, partial [Gemmataceae bacterium]|nr:hypothetical protein [Gemmataceae bacterium]
FDEGIVWQSGGQQEAAWDEIDSFRRTEILFEGSVSRRDIAIETDDGRKAVFTMALSKWEKLADRMQEETTAVQLPEARARFAAGETIRFVREVAVGRDGLVIQGKTVPNERIEGMRVMNGYLVAQTSDRAGLLQVSLGETPNIGVLLALLSNG